MTQTSKLGLYLIDESTPLNSSTLNENYGILTAALDTELETIQSGTLVDNDLLNTNFQIIDNAWLDTSDATATASQILSGYTAYADGSKITGTYIPPSGVQLQYTTSCSSVSNPLNNGMPVLSFYVPGIKTTSTLVNFGTAIGYYYNGSGDSNGNLYYGIVGGIFRLTSPFSSNPATLISGNPGQQNGFSGYAIANIWVPTDNYIYVDNAFVLHGGSFSANVLTNFQVSYFEAAWY